MFCQGVRRSMRKIRLVLIVVADLAAVALLLVLIFGGFRYKVIRTAADVLRAGPHAESWVVLDKRANSLDDLARGDVVLFRYFADAESLRLGRVLAVPGDTVWVEEGAAYVNGHKASNTNGRDTGRIGRRVVAANALFLSEGTDGNPLTSGYRMNDAHLVSGRQVAVLLPLRNLSLGGFKPFAN